MILIHFTCVTQCLTCRIYRRTKTLVVNVTSNRPTPSFQACCGTAADTVAHTQDLKSGGSAIAQTCDWAFSLNGFICYFVPSYESFLLPDGTFTPLGLSVSYELSNMKKTEAFVLSRVPSVWPWFSREQIFILYLILTHELAHHLSSDMLWV